MGNLRLYAAVGLIDGSKLFVTDFNNQICPVDEEKPKILVPSATLENTGEFYRLNEIVQEAETKFKEGEKVLEPSVTLYSVFYKSLISEEAYKRIEELGREGKLLEAMMDYGKKLRALDMKLGRTISRLQHESLLDRVRGV